MPSQPKFVIVWAFAETFYNIRTFFSTSVIPIQCRRIRQINFMVNMNKLRRIFICQHSFGRRPHYQHPIDTWPLVLQNPMKIQQVSLNVRENSTS